MKILFNRRQYKPHWAAGDSIIVVYDDYNSNIRADQSTIGTLTLNIGSSSLRNAYKLIEVK